MRHQRVVVVEDVVAGVEDEGREEPELRPEDRPRCWDQGRGSRTAARRELALSGRLR